MNILLDSSQQHINTARLILSGANTNCRKEWVVLTTWLQTNRGDSGYEKYIFVLEVNYISNLSQNSIPYK